MRASYGRTQPADLDRGPDPDETATAPYWNDAAPMPRFHKLERNLTVDVVVVGGGITGLTAALLLKRAGRRVAVLERARCAGVDTGHTSGHLTCVTDTPLSTLVDRFGEDHARAVWDAGLAAIAQIDACVRTERIDCGFTWVEGHLHADPEAAATDAEAARLKREADTAASLGFDARYLDRVPLVHRPGVAIDGQARLHPRHYLAGLARAVDGGGSFVFEHTAAEEVAGEPLSVSARGRVIRCADLVIATHNPIVGKAGWLSATFLQTKLSLYTSYVVGGRVASGVIPDALFWDTAEPYHYLRIDRVNRVNRHRGYDFVIFGGEDHKTGQEPDTGRRFVRLERALAALLPGIEITHRWSGQVIGTSDGLPFIGPTAPHQFAATGFSGNGLTFGTLGAMMACDAITGRANPWAELFDPGRTKIRGGLWDYIRENKDYPYYMIRDRFAGAEARTLRAVKRGSGKLVDLNGTEVAAYRAPDGAVEVKSPICTHMGCRVQWNDAGGSWDCPCHGSRFAPSGAVIAGPAEAPLADPPSPSP